MEVDGLVGAPWAVDANGISVPASYEVLGDGTVTMHVEHDDDVAYPVVADPAYTGGGFRVTWNVLTPHLVTAQFNKARTADAEDGGAAVCVLIAFVPVVGTIVAAICVLHNVAIRATSRYGYCQQWALNLVSRSFSVGLYKGGWCS